jgi:hypothetical protein
MNCLGISKEGAALLCKRENRIELEWSGPNVKPLDMKVHVVTGLDTSFVVRRETALKLKKEKEIVAALPFQVENLIPFPQQETILQPCLLPQGEIVLFATQKAFLRHHLLEMASQGIDPDQVACVPIALHRWGKWRFPSHTNLCILSSDCCTLSLGEKVAFAQNFQDRERILALIKSKYPEVPIVEAEEFAIPIGLALEGFFRTVQFRQGEFTPLKHKNRIRQWQWSYVAAALFLAATIFGVGSYQIGQKKFALQSKLSQYGAPEGGSLQERLDAWEKGLISQPSLAQTTPLVTELLHWFSTLQAEIDIIHLHYALPTAKVDLDFKAPSPAVARAFHELLLQGPAFVDATKEITWNTTQDRYKTSFYLK